MRKSLSLLAIVGLLLSLGLVGHVFANAPVYNDIPDLKLFVNQGLTPAFDLAQFNSGPDAATSYSVTAAFLGNSTLSGSSVNQGGFSNITAGNNSYSASNAGGTTPSSNRVKTSTFKIYELPLVGLNVGNSYTVKLFAINSVGTQVIPPSFGNASALIVSDTTKVSAAWGSDTNSVVITLLAATSVPVNVDVIAAAVASAPYGSNIDKERIKVYSSIINNGTFATAADTSAYGLQAASGGVTQAAAAWLATKNDSAGTSASGVYEFTLAGTGTGVKMTPFAANYFTASANQWYISRVRVTANAGNAHQGQIFIFNGIPGAGSLTDVAGIGYFGIPSTWTWIESPVFAHAGSANGYPQVQFKSDATGGAADIDEIQVINATPLLVSASRGNTRLFYDVSMDTTKYGTQLFSGSVASPTLSYNNSTAGFPAVTLSFPGGSNVGIKATANNGVAGTIYTPTATVGRQVGARGTFTRNLANTGTFNTSVGGELIAVFGVSSSGDQTIAETGTNLIASGEIAQFVDGDIICAGAAATGFYQLQYGMKNDTAGIMDISKVDFLSDTNDPNYGDIALFP